MDIQYLFGTAKINDREKGYIEQKITKVERLLGREKPEEVKASVEIDQDKHLFWRISVSVVTPKKVFRVSKKDSDLLQAMDVAEEALMKQIRRKNEKIRDVIRGRKRKG